MKWMGKMRVHHPDRFSVHPSAGGGILIICGYEDCDWRYNLFPTRIDAIVVPVVLEDILTEVNMHMSKCH